MFSRSKDGKLDEEEIKGLICELLFLKNYMMIHYDVTEACAAWIGANKTDQDFQARDYWYEIKSTTSGNSQIKISSLEQLDAGRDGYLCVLSLDRTSVVDLEAVMLNNLVLEISQIMEKHAILDEFEEKLLKSGYRNLPDYDNYPFRLNGSRMYKVDKKFPALRRSDISYMEIINAVYTLDLSSISPCCKDFV